MLFIFLPALAESFKYSLEFAAIKFNYVEQEYIGFENYVEAVTNDTDFLPMLYSAIRGTLVDLVVILFFSFSSPTFSTRSLSAEAPRGLFSSFPCLWQLEL